MRETNTISLFMANEYYDHFGKDNHFMVFLSNAVKYMRQQRSYAFSIDIGGLQEEIDEIRLRETPAFIDLHKHFEDEMLHKYGYNLSRSTSSKIE